MLDLTPIRPSLAALQAVERELNAALIERDEGIRAALVALLAREHLVVLGPPGTGKSHLVAEIARRISPPGGAGLQSFTYLMTRFTTPEELFGQISVSGLKRDDYRRVTAGKLPEAQLVFLDEIFKASSAILNALLRILNERLFSNGSQEMAVPLISLVGASNEMPQGNDLDALWDRFLLRLRVSYLSDGGFSRLIRRAAANGSQAAAPPQTLSQTELAALQQAVGRVEVPGGVLDAVEQLRRDLAGRGITLSDRRWGETFAALRAHALLEGRGAVGEDDLGLLKHGLWQTPEQQGEVGKLIARLGNPLNSKAVDLGDQAASIHKDGMQGYQSGQSADAKTAAAVEAAIKLKSVAKKLDELRGQAAGQGRNTARIDKVVEQVTRMRQEFTELAL
jgi:MoxR-like ATPase